MTRPRLLILVHGAEASAEGERARQLSLNYPREFLSIHYRGTRQRGVWSAARRAVQAGRPEVLYVMNTAWPRAPLACWLRYSQGLPFLLDTGDAIAAMARSAGTRPSWQWPLLQFFEQAAMRAASTVVVRGTAHAEWLHGEGIRRVRVMRDGFSPNQELDPRVVEALRAQLRLKGRLVVGMMGSLVHSPRLGITYGWDVLRALAQLGDLPVSGLILGDGPGWSGCERRPTDSGFRIGWCSRAGSRTTKCPFTCVFSTLGFPPKPTIWRGTFGRRENFLNTWRRDDSCWRVGLEKRRGSCRG